MMISNNILIISDTHIPFEHPDYLDFVNDVKKSSKCTKIIHIGDFLDNHSINFHEHNPDGQSNGDELKTAIKHLKLWIKAFPKMHICYGNHDILPYRQAKTNGFSKALLKDINDLFEMPYTWEWAFRHDLQGIIFQHGTGHSGTTGHLTAAKNNMRSTVIGHIHSDAGVIYFASMDKLLFGMNVGSGVDIKAYALEYAKEFTKRQVLGCGVIADGIPHFIPMKL